MSNLPNGRYIVRLDKEHLFRLYITKMDFRSVNKTQSRLVVGRLKRSCPKNYHEVDSITIESQNGGYCVTLHHPTNISQPTSFLNNRERMLVGDRLSKARFNFIPTLASQACDENAYFPILLSKPFNPSKNKKLYFNDDIFDVNKSECAIRLAKKFATKPDCTKRFADVFGYTDRQFNTFPYVQKDKHQQIKFFMIPAISDVNKNMENVATIQSSMLDLENNICELTNSYVKSVNQTKTTRIKYLNLKKKIMNHQEDMRKQFLLLGDSKSLAKLEAEINQFNNFVEQSDKVICSSLKTIESKIANICRFSDDNFLLE